MVGDSNVQLLEMRNKIQKYCLKGNTLSEIARREMFLKSHGKMDVENALRLGTLSNIEVGLRRLRNIANETDRLGVVEQAEAQSADFCGVLEKLVVEKKVFLEGSKNLFSFCYFKKFTNEQVECIKRFCADFLPTGVVPEISKRSDIIDAQLPVVFGKWVSKLNTYDISAAEVGNFGRYGICQVEVPLHSGEFPIGLKPGGNAQLILPQAKPDAHGPPLSGILIDDSKCKESPPLMFESIGGPFEGLQWALHSAEFSEKHRAYHYRFIDSFAMELFGTQSRTTEYGPVGHIARMFSQMGYDFASFCRNMKNAGIFIPDKSERKTHREEGTIIQLDLQKVRWDDFAFRLVFAGTRGTGTYVEPFAVTEAKVLLAKGSGNQTVWTLNARFPEKIIAIEEFAFSKENEPRIVQRVGLDSFRTC